MGDNDNDNDNEEIRVAPGFRFYPTEEELLSFYLHQKLHGRRQDIDRVIPEVYIYDYNPWDLPKLSGERCRNDPQLKEWFFFIPKHEKEAKGGRPNRLTKIGYWKATGSPMKVYSSTDNKIIGEKKTMVFYRGRARSNSSSKTDWKMNEYIPVDDQYSSSDNPSLLQNGNFTVCRVYIKSKCLRAFDRRPAAPPIKKLIRAPQVHIDVPSSSNPQQNQAQPRCISCESCSASEDQVNNNDINTNPSQAPNNEQDNIMNMELDQQEEHLWEFDWDWMVNWNI